MADEHSYRVKIKKGDSEVEIQGDKEWVEEKYKELSEFLITSQPEPLADLTKPPHISQPLSFPDSIMEFYNMKGSPKTHTDKAIIFAYWLSKKEGFVNYNYVDIETCYEKALIAKPGNTTDVMNRNQKKGFLLVTTEKDNMKAWRITSSGEEYVENMG